MPSNYFGQHSCMFAYFTTRRISLLHLLFLLPCIRVVFEICREDLTVRIEHYFVEILSRVLLDSDVSVKLLDEVLKPLTAASKVLCWLVVVVTLSF